MANFTPEQQKVICHDQGNIVVSASAGSGKTSVMIERLIRLISEDKASVKNILAVTFTRLAAGEMREKLANALIEKIQDGKDVERMRKELNDLPFATISTIDSFLNTLVSKYFYLVGVDSHYAIVGEADAKALKALSINEVFERLYDEDDSDLNLLLRSFLHKRSDGKLRELVLSIYTACESQLDYDSFLNACLDNYTTTGHKNAENRLIDQLFEEVYQINDSLKQLYLLAKAAKSEKFITYLGGIVAGIESCEKSPRAIKLFKDSIPDKPKKTAKDTEDVIEISEQITKEMDQLKKTIKRGYTYFEDDDDIRLERTLKTRPLLEALVRLVRLFTEEYSKQKREQNLLDYSDLSRLAYKILQNKEVIADIHNTYKYIFVDEYQDTNGIQEAIFRLLEQNNLFIVGDIKQSIYGFRGCDSDIFANRISEAEKGDFHVGLDANFRSAKAVVNAVNKVFSQVMTQKTMGLDYALTPMVYGNLYGDYLGEAEIFTFEKGEKVVDKLDGIYSVEKHLNKQKSITAKSEVLTRYLVQKSVNKPIYDIKTKQTVPAKYGDITILTRNNKGIADRIAKELDTAGIPVVTESKRSIGDYPEIQLIINILKCIYSPEDDIALATTLKSPLGGFSDKDLLSIRQNATTVSFYEAANKAATAATELGTRLIEFFDKLAKLRLLSKFEGVPSILNRIMADGVFEGKMLSMRGGEMKIKRIQRFIQECFKGDSEISISEFLASCDELLSQMTLSSGGGDDAVKIMSMHASKGLEFPICIIAGFNEKWNKRDFEEPVILDKNAGLGLKYYDFDTKAQYSTAIMEIVKLEKSKANLKDELRLIYVALTRAKCVLYLVPSKPLSKTHERITARTSSHLNLFAQTDMGYCELSQDAISHSNKQADRQLLISGAKESDVEVIKKYANFEYGFKDDTKLSLKKSVTESIKDNKFENAPIALEKPVVTFASDTETGTIYHKALELFDFAKISDNGYIDRLLSENFTAKELEKLSKENLNNILKLDVFNALKGFKLYKEQPFIVHVPSEMVGEVGQEEVLLQGVIDLLAINGDKAYIIDYKHSGASAKTLKERYSKQLDLYAYAVEKVLKLKVEKRIIVNIMRLEQVEL